MSDENFDVPINYVRSVVADLTPIDFVATCEHRAPLIVITLTKGRESQEFTIGEEFLDGDSDAITDALRMPMEQARRAVLQRELIAAGKKAARAKPGKKRKKAKAKRPARVKLVDARPEIQDAADAALAPIESGENICDPGEL